MGRTNLIRLLAVCAVLSGLTAFTFWPVSRAEFVNFDDNSYVTQNPNVLGGLTAINVAWAFKTAYFGNWHPITWLSHMLDMEMFGFNPGYHHLSNLFLHICNTCLLFLFLNRATNRTWPSAVVTALFAIHPLHVESVAWISERKDVLSTFFALLSLLAYLRYVQRKSKIDSKLEILAAPYFLLSLVFFVLGLMSKAMIVTLPFLMLLLDFWPLSRFQLSTSNLQPSTPLLPNSATPTLRLFLEKLPFLALTVFFTVISSRALALTNDTHARHSTTYLIANAFASYGQYLSKTFWPVDLAAFYPRPTTLPVLQVAASVAALIVLSVVALFFARRRPYVFVGWFWFVGTLVPVIILPFGDHAMADRYTYFPLIGLFIAIIWTLSKPPTAEASPLPIGWGEGSRVRGSVHSQPLFSVSFSPKNLSLTTAAILLIGICAIISRHQLKYWRTSKDLLEHVLAVTGDSAMVHNNLGALVAAQGNWSEAERHFAKAVQLQPMLPETRVNLAIAAAHLNKTQEASDTLNGLNPAWEAEGRRQLAEIFLAEMKTNAAIEQYSYVVLLSPSNATVREKLGLLLANQGKIADASEQFAALVLLAPNAQSHYHLALSLLIQGKAEEAIVHYKEAIRLKPEWPEPLNDLAWLFATYPRAEVRNGPEAVELAERACQLTNFKRARFLGTLDAAYAEAGRFLEAITTAEQTRNLASAAGDKTIADLAEERLKLYRSGNAFHQQ